MADEDAGLRLIAEGLAAYLRSIGQADDANRGFLDRLSGAGGPAGAFQQVVTGALREVGAIATRAMGEAAKAVGSFLSDSVGKAGDFEAGMNEFRAVAGQEVDARGLEQFRDLFISLGRELPVSTSEVQAAATELVKGGIDPATVAAGGLEASLKFAAAAMDGDLVAAAEISSKVVGGWAEVNATAAEKAELLAHAQDTLTKAANASSVGVDDLSLGLFNVQGNAKLAGIGLDETVTALALLAPNFSSAATAGTSLNALIARLQPSTKPAEAAMQALGLWTKETGSVFYDAQGNFVGWAQTAQLLQDATNGLTDAQKQSMFQTIFGMDAMGAASELTRQGAEGYVNMTAALEAANGVQANAAIKQQGFNVALDNAKGSIEALQITLGSQLLPLLTSFINDHISPAINTITSFADSIFGATDPLLAFAQTLGSVSPGLSNIAFYLVDLIRHGHDLGGWLSTTPPLFQGLVGAVEQAIPIVREVIASFQQGGIASEALGGYVDALKERWEVLQGAVGRVIDGVVAVVMPAFALIQRFLNEHGDEIVTVISRAWEKINTIINKVIQIVGLVIGAGLTTIGGLITTHGDDIYRVMETAWGLIAATIETALGLIEGVVSFVLQALEGDWEGAHDTLLNTSSDFVRNLLNVFENGLELIASLFGTSLEEIGRTWQGNWDMFVQIVEKVAERVGSAGRAIVEAIRNGISAAWSGLVEWFQGKLSELTDQLPFSEPKDHASPLYGLSRSGQSIAEMIQAGLDAAGPLQIAPLSYGMMRPLLDAGRVQAAATNAPSSVTSTTSNTWNIINPLPQAVDGLAATVRMQQMLAYG